MKTFRELGITAKLSLVWMQLKMTYKVLFGWLALLFIAGSLIYFVAYCIIRAQIDRPFVVGEALAWLVWLPTTVVAVFFGMRLVMQERDAGVIETLFTVSVSRYRIWIVKFVVLQLFVGILALVLIVLTDVFAIDLSILPTLLAVIPPLIFFAALTVYFSVLFKSGSAAALCVTAIVAFVLMISEGISITVVFPYLNPFDRPVNADAFIWLRTILYNKVGYSVLGGVSFWRAMRRLDRRERLLG